MTTALRSFALAVILALGCGGSGSATPARPAEEPAGYYHPERCEERGMACDSDECIAHRTARGETEREALEACMQDCNCGE